LDQLRVIVGAKLPLRKKVSLLTTFLKCMRWKSERLWHELRAAAGMLLGLDDGPRALRPQAKVGSQKRPALEEAT
jgi:hypothetical protein